MDLWEEENDETYVEAIDEKEYWRKRIGRKVRNKGRKRMTWKGRRYLEREGLDEIETWKMMSLMKWKLNGLLIC